MVTERYAVSIATQTGTTTFSPASGTTAGANLVLAAASGSAKTISGVSDTQNGAWAGPDAVNSGSQSVSVWSFPSSKALSTSDVITITWSAVTSLTTNIWLEEVTGGAAASWFDKTAAGAATSNSPAAGPTATLSQPNEICFALIGSNSGSATLSGTGSFTGVTTMKVGTGNLLQSVVAANTAVSFAGTFSASVVWRCLIVTYKLTGGSVARLALLGVG